MEVDAPAGERVESTDAFAAPPLTRWKVAARLVIITGVFAPLLAVGVEGLARYMHMDARQGEPMTAPGAPKGYLSDYVRTPGVDYTPRKWKLDDDGFDDGFGHCDFHFHGKTFLAFGDSTTVWGTLPDGDNRDWISSWATLLKKDIPADWQVCTIAEVGYHPVDYLDMWRLLAGRLHPDAATVLLCENDLTGQPERIAANVGGEWTLFHSPEQMTEWADDPFPSLYEPSEAWRFMSWRIADHTGAKRMIHRDVPHRQASDALTTLEGEMDLKIYYLWPLTADSARNVHVDELQTAVGKPIVDVDLPAEKVPLQLQPGDTVHMNHIGHERFEAQVLRDTFGRAAPTPASTPAP